MTIRVLIADDEAMVRRGFRMILQAEPDLEVVAEAANGEEAVAAARKHRPDVALLDIRMPVQDGISATKEVVAADDPRTRVLILTTFADDDYVLDALRAGASGFLLKNSPPERLVEAVHIVAAGDALLDPMVTRAVIKRFAGRPVSERGAASQVDARLLGTLTQREREVLVLVARGLSNSEIAEQLVVGTGTAKTHVSNVLMKLGLRDRTQAVVFAYESGAVQPGR